MLRNVREAEDSGPILLHVITRKGHGYAPAEASADKYHAVNRFNVITGAQVKGEPKPGVVVPPAYTKVFADSLIEEAEADPLVVAITAAMPSGTGLDRFAEAFPDRTFDVGIAEQHAVTFAAGMATEGMKPFCAIYSTFLQRAYDQVVHDVAMQGLPVRFAHRPRRPGRRGRRHPCRQLRPRLSRLPAGPGDHGSVRRGRAQAHGGDRRSRSTTGRAPLRYPRGEGTGACTLPARGEILEIGRGRVMREGGKVAILSLGTRLAEALRAADELAARGLSTTVVDARFAKPLDAALIEQLARHHEVLITIEEGSVGGFAQPCDAASRLDRVARQRHQVPPDGAA